MQEQIIKVANEGEALSQRLIEIVRDIGASVNHVTAIGLPDKLGTLATEFATFAAWDQTGAIPEVDGNAIAIANPKYQAETRQDRRIKMTVASEGVPSVPEIIDGAQQYYFVTVFNEKYNANIKPFLFASSTDIEVDSNGAIVGVDQSIANQITRLTVAGLLSEFLGSDPDTNGSSILARIESTTTITASKR